MFVINENKDLYNHSQKSYLNNFIVIGNALSANITNCIEINLRTDTSNYIGL